jgi:hypothetical protein
MDPEQSTVAWLAAASDAFYHRLRRQGQDVVSGRSGAEMWTCHKFLDFVAYRDITFFWKFL